MLHWSIGRTVKEHLLDALVKSCHLQSATPLGHRRPGHGSCCTCQTCGHGYNDCVCDNNGMLKVIDDVFAEYEPAALETSADPIITEEERGGPYEHGAIPGPSDCEV